MAEQRFCKPQVLGSNPSGGYQEVGFSESRAKDVPKPTPPRAASRRTDPDLAPYGAGSDLARLIDAWSTLAAPIRVGIMAMVDATDG